MLTLFLTAASQVPPIRDWLTDHLWPPRSNVRLAVLPVEGQVAEASTAMSGALQVASDRLSKMRSERRTVIVIAPNEVLNNRVDTVDEAKAILHATHALKTSVHREGNEWVARAAVVDLETRTIVRELTGRYSMETVGNLPAALAGVASLALRLQTPVAAETLNTEASVAYGQGLTLLRNEAGGYEKAIAPLEQAARRDPNSTLPLTALTEAYIAKFKSTKEAGSIEDAQRTLAKAESINPDSVRVRLVAGMLAEANGEYEKAREDYQRVHELDSRNVDAYLRLANVDNALNNAERAIDSYRKAIALEPEYYKPYHNFGVFYYYRGKYREAAEQFTLAVERAPGRIDEYTNLAAALSDLGDDARAEQTLLASIGIRETASALNSLGAIRAFQKRDAEAVELYRRAIKLDAGYYVYWLNLGDASRRLGVANDATAAYEKGLILAKAELAQNPRLGLPRSYAAYFAARLGQTDRAKDEIEEAIKFSPEDSKVIRRAILTHEVLGSREKTFKLLDNAGPDLLRELERHPDLTGLAGDPRFRELISHPSP